MRQAVESAKVALVVSPLLVLVNHYDELSRGRWSILGFKAGLTFLVPFLVSYHSARAALRQTDSGGGQAGRARKEGSAR